MNWRETIFVVPLALFCLGVGWHYSDKAVVCLPFKIGGAWHVGDICR